MNDIGTIMLKDVRLAFPVLWVPRPRPPGPDGKPGKPNFSANFILTPDHPDLAKVKALILAVARDQWKDKAEIILKGLKAQDRTCLHDGDTKAQYSGFAGNMFVAANTSTRPTVIDRSRAPLTEADGRPYPGCYVNASLAIRVQDHAQWGKRVNAYIRGVQFVRDGDAFGSGSVASQDEFEDLGDQTSAGGQADDADPLA